jgi:hypothetical protein
MLRDASFTKLRIFISQSRFDDTREAAGQPTARKRFQWPGQQYCGVETLKLRRGSRLILAATKSFLIGNRSRKGFSVGNLELCVEK